MYNFQLVFQQEKTICKYMQILDDIWYIVLVGICCLGCEHVTSWSSEDYGHHEQTWRISSWFTGTAGWGCSPPELLEETALFHSLVNVASTRMAHHQGLKKNKKNSAPSESMCLCKRKCFSCWEGQWISKNLRIVGLLLFWNRQQRLLVGRSQRPISASPLRPIPEGDRLRIKKKSQLRKT